MQCLWNKTKVDKINDRQLSKPNVLPRGEDRWIETARVVSSEDDVDGREKREEEEEEKKEK